MPLTLTVGTTGQIILGKKVLEHLGVRKGDRVKVDLLRQGGVRLDAIKGRPMSSWFGRLAHLGTERLSVEQLNEVSAAGWAGDGATPRET